MLKKLSGLLLVGFIWVVGSGCAHVDVAAHMLKQPPVKADGLPRIKIDEAASLLVVKYMTSEEIPKQDVIRTVNTIWNQKAVGEGEGVPSRVIIEAKSSGPRSAKAFLTNELVALYTGGVLFLFGVPTAWDAQTVTFRIQIGNKEYVGTETGKCWANMYKPADPGPCAFSKALTGAIRRVAEDVVAGVSAGTESYILNQGNSSSAVPGSGKGVRTW